MQRRRMVGKFIGDKNPISCLLLFAMAICSSLTAFSAPKYLVIDVSGGATAEKYPVSGLNSAPKGGWPDEYKTEKIVLRQILAGEFDRTRRTSEEAWHHTTNVSPVQVSVSNSFYIGVFEISQRQYECVTGRKPSYFSNEECWMKRPVENVSYSDIRGEWAGSAFPQSRKVDPESFLGILRAKTGLGHLDLPTENIWEYACRQGGASAGMDAGVLRVRARIRPENANGKVPYAFAKCGLEAGTAEIGSREPDTLGLYDMQGNVGEWCLDGAGDPQCYPGPDAPGRIRVVKGGFWDSVPEMCDPSLLFVKGAGCASSGVGFRLCLQ